MTSTFWLASYPKSGNTWFRMLLANLAAPAPVDINNLPDRGGIASAREPFDYLSLIDSGLLNPNEIDSLRPRIHEAIAGGSADDEYDSPGAAPAARFVKVHDAYTFNRDGEPLLAGRKAAQGAIVIVRDPRDVVPSLANHLHTGIEEAIAFLNNQRAQFCGKLDCQPIQLRQQLLSWSGHMQSWLQQTDIPVHLVRYEDMLADPVGIFGNALEFAGQPAAAEDIQQAVRHAEFAQLRQQEDTSGFRESPRHGAKFFRRGQAGCWRTELTPEQVERIEIVHAPLMRKLGYEPVQIPLIAKAG